MYTSLSSITAFDKIRYWKPLLKAFSECKYTPAPIFGVNLLFKILQTGTGCQMWFNSVLHLSWKVGSCFDTKDNLKVNFKAPVYDKSAEEMVFSVVGPIYHL
jgi:hypothetical protein